MDALDRLQQWYMNECNGDWEHSFGVKIDTLDNPGWIVKIDLMETKWEDLTLSLTINKRSESDWVQYETVGKQFVACGGPFNLKELIERFLELVGV